MTFTLAVPRVLICGSRELQGGRWRLVIETICDRLYATYGSDLVLIHGGARGADVFCGDWCGNHGFDEEHHRCHPVDWRKAKQELGKNWKRAGNDRNTKMLLAEQPRLIVGVHPWFSYATGGTSDMLLKGALTGVPSWLIRQPTPNVGEWVDLRPYLRVVGKDGRPWRIDTALGNLVKAGWMPPPELKERLAVA